MTIQVFGHRRCAATRAAERFFSERHIKYQFIDLHTKGMSKGEFDAVARVLGVEALFDPASPRLRQRGLQYAQPNRARMAELLVEDGKLFRTPVVRNGPRATAGPAAETWAAWIAAGQVPT